MSYLKKINYFRIFLSLIVSALIILIFLVKQRPYFGLDLEITLAIQSYNAIWFNGLMNFLSWLGDSYQAVALVSVIVFFLLYLKKKREAEMTVLSASGILLVSTVFKELVSRSRPDPELVRQVSQFFRDDSFPSGHVLFFIGFFGFLIYLVYTNMAHTKYRRIIIMFISVLIILIGPSRIYLGAHWFSDVLGSYLIGTLWLSLMVNLYHRLKLKE